MIYKLTRSLEHVSHQQPGAVLNMLRVTWIRCRSDLDTPPELRWDRAPKRERSPELPAGPERRAVGKPKASGIQQLPPA